LRNRGVDVGGDDVAEDTDYDSVENALTDSFGVELNSFDDVELNSFDDVELNSFDDVELNSFGAGLLEEEGADGDLVSAGDGDGDGEEADGVYHLEVSLSRTVLVSAWASVALALCCVSGCCWFHYGKPRQMGRFEE